MGKLKKITEYALYLLVFLLPLQTRWMIKLGQINGGYSEYGTISLYGTDILLIIVLLLNLAYRQASCCVVAKNIKPITYNPKPIWWLIAGLDLFVFISIFFAPDKILALYHYGLFLLGVGLFWLISSANYSRVKLIWSFFAGLVLQSGLGIWQFLTQSSFANKWLGLAAHPSSSYSSVIEAISGGRWLRAYGSLDHPNMLGGALAVGIFLVTILNFPARLASESVAGKQFLNRFKNILLFAFCFLLFTALFFTFSRASWLGLAIGLAVMLIFAMIKKDLLAQKIILKFILAGALVFIILGTIYSDLLSTRLVEETSLEVKSNTERIESLDDAKNLIKNYWLFGVGVGNYTLALSQDKPGLPSYIYQPAHNTLLLIWAEVGIFGLIFFIALLCVIRLRRTSVLCKNNFGVETYSSLAIVFALFVMLQFDHWWWSLHFGVLLLWLTLGLLFQKVED
jgi:O-antigen ligase